MPRSLEEKGSRPFEVQAVGSRSDIHPRSNVVKIPPLPPLIPQNPPPTVSQELSRPSVLSRLAASLLPHSSTSGAHNNGSRKHSAPMQSQISASEPETDSNLNISVKTPETDKKDRKKKQKDHKSKQDATVKSSKSPSSHSVGHHSTRLLEEKNLKLKFNRSHTSSASLAHGRESKDNDLNANDKRKSGSESGRSRSDRSRQGSGNILQEQRSSSRDKVRRASEDLNNSRRSSRHSSRDKFQFDSHSNLNLVASPRSSERLSRRSSRLRPSSKRTSLTRQSKSREIWALPIEATESTGDVDTFRQFLARSSSSRGGPGPPESVIGYGIHQEIPKHILAAFNGAVHRRTTALSMAVITLALLSGSASQLRFMMAYANAHQYPQLNYFLICMSIVIEVVAGVGYMILSRFDFSEACVEKTHSILIFGLFLIAISNVIISAFSLDDHVCEILDKAELDYIDQTPPKSVNDFPL